MHLTLIQLRIFFWITWKFRESVKGIVNLAGHIQRFYQNQMKATPAISPLLRCMVSHMIEVLLANVIDSSEGAYVLVPEATEQAYQLLP